MSFTTPTTFANNHTTTLRNSFTSISQTTGITGNPLQHNGVDVSWAITGAQLLLFSKGKYKEYIYFPSASVDSTTKVITWGTAQRDIPWNDGSSTTSASTGVKKWGAGTNISLVWAGQHSANVPFKDVANTFSAQQTFSNGLLVTGASLRPPVYASTSARDSAIPSPSNADKCYVTGVGEQTYTAGSWVTVNASGSSIGTTSSAGTFEAAVVSEQASHAATGGTGALAVPTTNNLVTLSADSTWVSGAIPTLNTSKYLDGSIGGTGVSSPATGSLLIGGGLGSAMTALALGSTGTVPRSDGTTLAMARVPFVAYTNTSDSNDISSGGSYTLVDFNTSYTIPANDLASGTMYTLEAHGIVSTSSDLGGKWGIKVGSNVLKFNDASVIAITSAGGTHVWTLRATIICRSTGASGTIQCSGELDVRTSTGTTIWKNEILVPNSTSTVDTTGTLTFCPQFGWQTDSFTRVCKVKNISITRL